jgi:hypothetical protein
MTDARRAIEALRAGVPNRPAIRLLGSVETELIEAFSKNLRAVEAALGKDVATPGQIIAGGFGAGKSHFLGYLQELALGQNFVVSWVSISKETPLFDAEKVFVAAMRNAQVAKRTDDAMTTVFSRLNPGSVGYESLQHWVGSAESGLSPMFSALLELIPRRQVTHEDQQKIARFFAGGKLAMSSVNQWLREAGLKKVFSLKPVKAAELTRQRLAFAPRLMTAAGYAGWCVLLDEVELIGRYSPLQRGRSYAELARWLGIDLDAGRAGVATVAAFTDDFKDRVIVDKRDDEIVPAKLYAKNEREAASLASKAIDYLQGGGNVRELRRPDRDVLRESLEKTRSLYTQAYAWSPPPTEVGEMSSTRSMRHHIKSWITGWDLQRLYAESATIEINPLAADYTESADIERAAELDEDDEADNS